jgi:hypothetical protein
MEENELIQSRPDGAVARHSAGRGESKKLSRRYKSKTRAIPCVRTLTLAQYKMAKILGLNNFVAKRRRRHHLHAFQSKVSSENWTEKMRWS